MKLQEYKEQRAALIAQAENALNGDDVENAAKYRKEIEQLDAAYDVASNEAANLAALQAKPILNLADKSVKVENITVVENTDVKKIDEKDVYKNAFGKWMMNQALSAEEATAFAGMNGFNAGDEPKFTNAANTTQEHSVLIPETVKEEIWTEIRDTHPIIGAVGMTFVPGDLTIIKETADIGVGEWVDEADEAPQSTMGFGELKLTGCELVKCVTISWKLEKMGINAFMSYVTSLLATKMGDALAAGILTGLGKPGAGDTFKAQPRGIITALEAEAGTPQIEAYTPELVYSDLTGAMALILSGYVRDAAVYANNQTIWNRLANIVNDNGTPMFVPDVTQGGVGRLFGIPVYEEAAIPADAVLIGNAGRGYTCNVNENITLYQERHVKARTTDYMSYAIIDGDVLTTKAFAYLVKA